MIFSRKKGIIIGARKGQAFLATVLLIGGIVVAAGILLAALVFSYIDSGYGLRASYVAEAMASAGAEDALLQLARNGSFSNPSGYTVAMGVYTATVTVNQNIPSQGLITILSAATVLFRTREVTAVVAEDPSTNQVTLISWQETQ